MQSHSRNHNHHRDYGQTAGEQPPTPANSSCSLRRFLAGRRLGPDNQWNVGTARNLDADGIAHALGCVVLLQPRAQAARLDPYHGIDLRVVVRAAIEYIESDRVFLQAVGITVEESFNDERKKTLEALRPRKSWGHQNVGHVVSYHGV